MAPAGAAMFGHNISRCVSGAAPYADKRLSSAAWMAMRDGITEVVDCSNGPSLKEGNGDGTVIAGTGHIRSHSSGAESRFLRSMSPIQCGSYSSGSYSTGNNAAQQQQRAADLAGSLAGSAVFPAGLQSRARRTSHHHRMEGIATTACGSPTGPTLHERAAAIGLQAAASVSVPVPYPLSNAAANPTGLLVQVMAHTSPDSTRHHQLSKGNSMERMNRPNLPLPQQQQQHQQHATARQGSNASMLGVGGCTQQGGRNSCATRSPSPMHSRYGVDSKMQHGVPRHFSSPRAMVMTVEPDTTGPVHPLSRATSQNLMPMSLSPRTQRQQLVP